MEGVSKMYNYVRAQYGVNPALGAWVFHTETRNWGVIARENKRCSHYVMVRFDGRRRADPCHPTALDYSSPLGPTLVGALRRALQDDRPTETIAPSHNAGEGK